MYLNIILCGCSSSLMGSMLHLTKTHKTHIFKTTVCVVFRATLDYLDSV